MQLLRRRAFARAGLVGNPSDGYNGKTIAISVRNYWAEVVLYEWDEVEIVLSQDDRSRFHSVEDLSRDVVMHGYYGGVRLVKATIKKFVDYCKRFGHELHDQNFAIRYSSNIPRQVGMAGSSAIIVATLRCLMDFYQVGIDRRIQPSLALSVEAEELGIGAGLQDRVVQVYEGLVAMDFSKKVMERLDGYLCGDYRWLDAEKLPPIYVAFRSDLSEPTEVFHNDLRSRYNAGESAVVDAMKRFAELTDQA
jgi:glucuronokinase